MCSLCGYTLNITCLMMFLSPLECNYLGSGNRLVLSRFPSENVQCWGVKNAIISCVSIILIPLFCAFGKLLSLICFQLLQSINLMLFYIYFICKKVLFLFYNKMTGLQKVTCLREAVYLTFTAGL